ncbi:MAG: Holliday junction branch migration protein RuvA [Deltaproteobacteria bacterium]|nr:Holliday junction branch migration protein RuvA [Deltaproteobacteria bacterium]
MIAFLRGRVIEKGPGFLVLDVGGVGYAVNVDVFTWTAGAMGDELSLFIRTVVREDSITLYGFGQAAGREVFDMLVSVAGVGPKLASQVMGGLAMHELVHAVRQKDLAVLTSIPGVGKKLAERLALELSDKFQALDVPMPGEGEGPPADVAEDVRSALLNLGFPARDAAAAVRGLKPEPGADLEDLIKQAIASMNS